MPTSYIACDLGAESGRVILGTLDGGKLRLEEVHRFANGPVRIGGAMRWDVLSIFAELKKGLAKVAAQDASPAGLSVDSWGVDYVLLSDTQPMLSLPYHYRDARTEQPYAAALEGDGPERIFAETGIQFMPLNTLYQLIAEVEQNSDVLSIADKLLPMGDYFNWLFSGVARTEVSLASTTQFYNPVLGDWSRELIERFNLPGELLPEVVPSGTRLGPLLPGVADESGLDGVEVVATCSHDTGAAVAAVPAKGDDWAYLSSGTWSLIGVELPTPLINEAARENNFTNEAGLGGTTRLLKNISGLWLLQGCRRAWATAGQEFDYAELNRLAEEAAPFDTCVNPNDPRFLSPADMPTAIGDFCRETGQLPPQTPGEFTLCILRSLALLYGQTLTTLEELTGRKINRLHIVGGGSQSELLNQMAANATGREVLAGPVEATAIGNVLIQAMALGHIESHAQLREVVRASFPITTYQPQSTHEWQEASRRFAELEKKP